MHVCPCGPLKGDKLQMGMLERFGSVSLCSFHVGWFFLAPVFPCSSVALRSWNEIFFPVQSARVCVCARLCVFLCSLWYTAMQRSDFCSPEAGNALPKGILRHMKVSLLLPPAAPAGSGEQ